MNACITFSVIVVIVIIAKAKDFISFLSAAKEVTLILGSFKINFQKVS